MTVAILAIPVAFSVKNVRASMDDHVAADNMEDSLQRRQASRKIESEV